VTTITDKTADPGAAICPVSHQHRIHYLGGGMRVCFECFAKLFTGGTRKR
jgi:hypothetical protein